MTCKVNDIYPQVIEIYIYNYNQTGTNVIQKECASVSLREKKLSPIANTRKQERKSVTGHHHLLSAGLKSQLFEYCTDTAEFRIRIPVQV